MKIRPMRCHDLNNVSTLYLAANAFAKKKDILAWTRAGLEKFPQFNLVYETRGEMRGAISGILSGKNIAVINDIAVLEKYRNQKIGSALLQTLLEKFARQGTKKVKLWVHWKNTKAIPFYYQFGFRIKKFSRTRNIPAVPDGEDIIHLEKTL